MDDIAKAAGYSKATLYVYFKNKEEIVGLLVLESMKKLYACLSAALEQQESTRAKYDFICQGLVQYQKEFPYYFQTALDKINIDFEEESCLPEEEETNTFPKPRLSGKRYMLLTACNTPFPFSWICGQSRGAFRNMDKFFKTAGMKCMGRFACTNTSKRKERE